MRAVTSDTLTVPSALMSQMVSGYDEMLSTLLMRAVTSEAFTSPSALMSPATDFLG